MASFNIYNSSGTILTSGFPKYNASYGKPDYLEFTISSPTPIAFDIGSYVEYRGDTFRLYTLPEPKKQAGNGLAGDAFVYQNLQFHSRVKEMEIFLFTNYVNSNNAYFFSSRESVSTYEDLEGIMARIEWCLNRQSPYTWSVQFAPGVTTDATLAPIIAEAHEFPIEGQSILDACNQVTEIFKGIGWTYDFSSNVDECYIYFGGPNVRVNSGTTTYGEGTTGPFVYGKGNGLVSIKKYQTNKDTFLTRLYAYGSDRNMVSRFYNNIGGICSASSVDIPNLMIPISKWGTSEDPDTLQTLPDARLAYIDDDDAIETYGLIPRRVYFNNEENGDIYPSIKGMTIEDVANIYTQRQEYLDTTYYDPDMDFWSEAERVDMIYIGSAVADAGVVNEDGTSPISYYSDTVASQSIPSTSSEYEILVGEFLIPSLATGNFSLSLTTTPTAPRSSRLATLQDSGDIAPIFNVRVDFYSDVSNYTSEYINVPFTMGGRGSVSFYANAIEDKPVEYVGSLYKIAVSFVFNTGSGGTTSISGSIDDFTLSCDLIETLTGTFTLSIPQIGFDILSRSATDGEPKIEMLDGMCGGRSFVVTKCAMNGTYDYWDLTLKRVTDGSTSMMYPNSTYQIANDDHFVITGIEMPYGYIYAAETRLLAAAQSYYDLHSTPKYLFTPEVDSSKIADSTFAIPRPGMYMAVQDTEITSGNTEYVLIDSVTIAENESSIPIVNITLRERLNTPSVSV